MNEEELHDMLQQVADETRLDERYKCKKRFKELIEELISNLNNETIKGSDLYEDENKCWMYKEDFERLLKQLLKKADEEEEK